MGKQYTDQELVERVQKGDKAAFDLLVRKYQHKVIKLISRYVRDQSEVHDVAQEAFIKAYRALANFRGESAFYTWLYRIAINSAKNYLLSRGRQPVYTESEVTYDDDDFSPISQQADTDTPENILLGDEVKNVVAQAIDRLPEDLRTAIILRELEGMSYDEIAQTMDCPVGTVRSRLFRAREFVDNELEKLAGK